VVFCYITFQFDLDWFFVFYLLIWDIFLLKVGEKLTLKSKSCLLLQGQFIKKLIISIVISFVQLFTAYFRNNCEENRIKFVVCKDTIIQIIKGWVCEFFQSPIIVLLFSLRLFHITPIIIYFKLEITQFDHTKQNNLINIVNVHFRSMLQKMFENNYGKLNFRRKLYIRENKDDVLFN